jgi:hypothetical protein
MNSSTISRGTRASGAIFSHCLRYRFELWRNWGTGRKLAFIGLNPSTADETRNDPTVTRCINFAKRDGFAGMVMLNIFGLRSTDPALILSPSFEPVGQGNDAAILKWLKRHSDVLAVACWGSHRSVAVREADVVALAVKAKNALHCFGVNQDGSPKHPLYLRGDTMIRPFPSEWS